MKNNDKGFTLVELVVSFAIIMILATISVVGVLAYQDYADFKRQNSYAQTLFTAAQSKLTGYSVRGEIGCVRSVADTPLMLDAVITPSGKSAIEAGTVKEGEVCYLMGTRETYEKYKAGEYRGKKDRQSRRMQALYDIFDEYLMDKSILSAAIALEYDPQDGLVYSVLYSDKNESFTYTSKNGNGKVNICNRQEDYRSEYLIGYYGLD